MEIQFFNLFSGSIVFDYFIRGIIIALVLAVPIGPISIMCIQNALNKGLVHGVIFGVGVALADLVYGLGITLGSTSFLSFFEHNKQLINVLGGIFLIYLGVAIFLSKSCNLDEKSAVKKRMTMFTGFFLTLANPLSPITIVATFNVFDIINKNLNVFTSFSVSFGLFLGSLLWWAILSFMVDKFKLMFTPTILNYLNKTAGMLIGLFGIFSVLR